MSPCFPSSAAERAWRSLSMKQTKKEGTCVSDGGVRVVCDFEGERWGQNMTRSRWGVFEKVRSRMIETGRAAKRLFVGMLSTLILGFVMSPLVDRILARI